MFINIITPCSRPENLNDVASSINIPKENYRWIVVFDLKNIPQSTPENAECYAHKDENSTSGNAQRNYALNLVKQGYVYFNDDDTTIHQDLWNSVKDLNNDFISFKQVWVSGMLRLDGRNITLNNIDSHNFLVHSSLIGNVRWELNRYDADGLFAHECWKKSKSYLYINEVLSVYNSLKH